MTGEAETLCAAAFGVMVNYRYIAGAVEENHERFVQTGEVALSKALARKQRRIDAAWEAA